MKYTTIRISEPVALKLRSLQESLSETYDDTLIKLIKIYEEKKDENL
jgi:hypothetical protein